MSELVIYIIIGIIWVIVSLIQKALKKNKVNTKSKNTVKNNNKKTYTHKKVNNSNEEEIFRELKKNMEEALRFHIEGMQEDGEAIPAEFSGEWEFEWHMTTAAMLHYVEKTVPKSAISKVTGINQQQLTHYASGWRRPRPDMRKRILDGIHAIGKELIAIS